VVGKWSRSGLGQSENGYNSQDIMALRRHEKGKLIARWGRKATGLYEKKRGCRATEWWGGQLPKGLALK
jgi:hypothetical protein